MENVKLLIMFAVCMDSSRGVTVDSSKAVDLEDVEFMKTCRGPDGVETDQVTGIATPNADGEFVYALRRRGHEDIRIARRDWGDKKMTYTSKVDGGCKLTPKDEEYKFQVVPALNANYVGALSVIQKWPCGNPEHGAIDWGFVNGVVHDVGIVRQSTGDNPPSGYGSYAMKISEDGEAMCLIMSHSPHFGMSDENQVDPTTWLVNSPGMFNSANPNLARFENAWSAENIKLGRYLTPAEMLNPHWAWDVNHCKNVMANSPINPDALYQRVSYKGKPKWIPIREFRNMDKYNHYELFVPDYDGVYHPNNVFFAWFRHPACTSDVKDVKVTEMWASFAHLMETGQRESRN